MVFRGRFEYAIDPKGRVSIPAPFRDSLLESGSESFVITSYNNCIFAYSLAEWTRKMETLAKVPSTDVKLGRFKRLFVGGSTEVVPDKQGRVLVPPSLRKYAGLGDSAVIVGMLSHFEIWSEERWMAEVGQLDADIANDPAFAKEISDLGI